MSAKTPAPEIRDLAELLRALPEIVALLREAVVLLRERGGVEAPKSKKLVGWKALVEVAVEHGGPGSENKLRALCRKRGAPVHVWRGMAAVADEARFRVWLDGLRVPIGLEHVGGGGKGRRSPGTAPKKRSTSTG